MTAAPELLPCPFCGGKPYLANVEMVGCSYVVCTDCRAQGDDMSKDRAIATWNTRAPAPELIRQAVAEERERADKAEAELRVAIGGCDANNGWNHSPIRLPNDPKYVFCSACGETMTPSQAKRHSSAAAIRAGE